MTTAEKLAEQLRISANLYEQMGRKTGPEKEVVLEFVVDGARFKIRAEECADGLRSRADKTLSQARKATAGTPMFRDARRALNFKPSASRSRYSEKMVQAFLEAGEPDNAEAYRALFNA